MSWPRSELADTYPCPACEGTGLGYGGPCEHCNGTAADVDWWRENPEPEFEE